MALTIAGTNVIVHGIVNIPEKSRRVRISEVTLTGAADVIPVDSSIQAAAIVWASSGTPTISVTDDDSDGTNDSLTTASGAAGTVVVIAEYHNLVNAANRT